MAGQASSQIPSLGAAIGPGPVVMTRGASPVKPGAVWTFEDFAAMPALNIQVAREIG